MQPRRLQKILVVDDDPDSIVITQFCLESLKTVEIQYASSGKEAIEKAKVFFPDLILIDAVMPEMDGSATMKELQKIPFFTKALFVFFTAKTQREELNQLLDEGAFAVITKPFDPKNLSSSLLDIWKRFIDTQEAS